MRDCAGASAGWWRAGWRRAGQGRGAGRGRTSTWAARRGSGRARGAGRRGPWRSGRRTDACGLSSDRQWLGGGPQLSWHDAQRAALRRPAGSLARGSTPCCGNLFPFLKPVSPISPARSPVMRWVFGAQHLHPGWIQPARCSWRPVLLGTELAQVEFHRQDTKYRNTLYRHLTTTQARPRAIML